MITRNIQLPSGNSIQVNITSEDTNNPMLTVDLLCQYAGNDGRGCGNEVVRMTLDQREMLNHCDCVKTSMLTLADLRLHWRYSDRDGAD